MKHRIAHWGSTTKRQRPGWIRLAGGSFGVWRHRATGWTVRHCGHPTALYPYYGEPPPRDPFPLNMLIAPNGHAFPRLCECQAAVEAEILKPGTNAAERKALTPRRVFGQRGDRR